MQSDGTIRAPWKAVPALLAAGCIFPDDAWLLKTNADPRYPDIESALRALFNTAINIESFTGGSVVEIGTIVESVALAWELNKQPVSQFINGAESTPDARSRTFIGPFTVDRTWTLAVSDGYVADTAQQQLLFRRRRY